MLFGRRQSVSMDAPAPHSLRRLFVDGVIVSLCNPKIAIFFLAFLPQFVDPGAGTVGWQIMLLGLFYVALALMTDGTCALLSGGLRNRLAGTFLQGPWPRYLSGGLYLGHGLNAALTGRRSKISKPDRSGHDPEKPPQQSVIAGPGRRRRPVDRRAARTLFPACVDAGGDKH